MLHCCSSFIGHLRITDDNLMVTISMLRFGQLVRGLTLKKPMTSPSEDENKLQILNSKKEFSQADEYKIIFSHQQNRSTTSQARVEQMTHVAKDYLDDKIKDIDLIMNVTDVKVVLEVMKNVHKASNVKNESLCKTAYDEGYAEALKTAPMAKKKLLPSSSHAMSIKVL